MSKAPQICTMFFPQRFLLIEDDTNIYVHQEMFKTDLQVSAPKL